MASKSILTNHAANFNKYTHVPSPVVNMPRKKSFASDKIIFEQSDLPNCENSHITTKFDKIVSEIYNPPNFEPQNIDRDSGSIKSIETIT